MRNDYGSLRRRTSDSSWQWLLMGTLMGLGFALVVCVGGYALGAISFPMLEASTATAVVRIEPNQTEVALQAIAAQQTLEALQQAQTPTEPIVPEETAAAPPETAEPTPLPALEMTPEPSADSGQPAVLNPTATLQGQPPVQTAPIAQDTPVLGTPPVGEPTLALGLPQPPAIPPELDAIKSEMVPVTGGTFMMGTTLEEGRQAMDQCALYGKSCTELSWISDSTPPHATTVDSFAMEVYEVSTSQYVTFLNWLGPNEHKTACGGNPCVKTTVEDANSLIEFDGTTYTVRNPSFYANHPVTNVTWWGAVEYCRTLNRRLPTEAEWERAARGSQNYIYPWGFEFDPARAMSSIATEPGTVPVDTYANGKSPYDIFNMAGNVSEWVSDWYQIDYYTRLANQPEPNPKGPTTGTEKVIRGGSWDTIPLFLRTVHRMSARPDQPNASIGFRCVADGTATTPIAIPAVSGESAGAAPDLSGAPTLAPAPTQVPLPTAPIPAGPTATLAPG